MEAPGPRKKANSVQVGYVGYPEFPHEDYYRSHSVADERSFFKKWTPFLSYGTMRGNHQESADLSDDEELLHPLPMQTLGHSMMQTTCYSRAGSSVHTRISHTSILPPESSLTTCVVTLTKTILGSGMLGLPYICYMNGMGLFLVLLILFSALNAYTMYLLVWATDLAHLCGHVPADMDFGSLGQLAFGDAGLRAVQIIVAIDLWGTLVAYMVVIADIVQPALVLLTTPEGLEWLCDRVPVIVLTACLVLPICAQKGIHALGSVAALGLAALSTFVVFLVLRCATTDFVGHVHRVVLLRFGMGVLRSLPVLAFLYNVHFNVFSIYNVLENRTSRRMGIVLVAACAVSTVVNLFVGAAGYILFLGDVRENVLGNMRLHDIPAAGVRALFGVALGLTYPVLAFELRQITDSFLFGRHIGKMKRMATAAGLVVSSACTAIAVPNVTVAFGLVGGTTTTAMGFILPPLFFLKLYSTHPATGRRYWAHVLPAWAVLAFGMLAVPVFTYLMVIDALG